MTRCLTAEEVLLIAKIALGAEPQIRDAGLSDSACHRPSATVFGEDAYPSLTLKAAALLHSLTANHPFIDGDKPTAWLATVVLLRDNDARVTVADAYDGAATDVVLKLADGTLREVRTSLTG